MFEAVGSVGVRPQDVQRFADFGGLAGHLSSSGPPVARTC
jgi:hypothetical protein